MASSLFRDLRDHVLDASVVRSFDASGFERHAARFVPGELDVDLSHRTVAITGANSGLGYATASALAARGARVLLLCRSVERGEAARETLARATGSSALELVPCDLSNPESIDEAAKVVTASVSRLDVLVHNAGVLPPERQVLQTGLELTLATNLVGPHRLSARLLPVLWRSAAETRDARLVHVSSGGMYTQKLDVERLANLRGSFDGAVAYARTKRAQVVLTEQLAKRWSGTGLRVYAMHPGWADTPGVQTSLPGFSKVMKGSLRNAEQGADTTVWLSARAVPPEPSGSFWFDRSIAPTTLLPLTRETPRERQLLWERLNEWAGTQDADFARPAAA